MIWAGVGGVIQFKIAVLRFVCLFVCLLFAGAYSDRRSNPSSGKCSPGPQPPYKVSLISIMLMAVMLVMMLLSSTNFCYAIHICSQHSRSLMPKKIDQTLSIFKNFNTVAHWCQVDAEIPTLPKIWTNQYHIACLLSTCCLIHIQPCILDSIAVSVFVVILVELDKYRIWDEQVCLVHPICTFTLFLAKG